MGWFKNEYSSRFEHNPSCSPTYPLHQIRPLSWMVDFCNPSVFWPRLSKPGEIIDRQLKCNAIVKEGENDADGELNAYRFAHFVGWQRLA